MRILVDADAFPNALKEVLLRSVKKHQIPTTFIANKPIGVPNISFIQMHIVPQGVDEADHFIALECQEGDLVITADIPLADRVIAKEALALDPRGTIYDKENIKSILAMRNLMQELRDSGQITGGPSGINAKTIRNFADSLQKLLNKLHNKS
jgi:hypothetical protein